ncbi:MAG: hypothetical protein KME03_12205 [Aphanocapsa lilacina HA4352-LM1]|jgi:hypothetical protein|nr:hypothetical protein [Aphanocapsa lilacina HA4352-LM1]
MQLFETSYKAYRCSRNRPLSCDVLVQTAQQIPGAKFCQECGFPTLLAEKSEIRGTRGTYRIVKFVGTRGMGRLYQAIQAGDNQPCVVKEYLLPSRCFNKAETRQRKDAFKRVAGLLPADGKNQDFRLVSPWEAIADEQGERCYLVTKGALETSPTLARHLAESGPMNAAQVRSVLNQVLQSLQFLHSQKFRLPSGQVQPGFAHGHLTLDSLLISRGGAQFFVYVCDLALWEQLFDPTPAVADEPLPEHDLIALGYVAYFLLTGQLLNPATGGYFDPRDPQQWPTVEPRLQEYLYRLMGLDVPFETAEAARAALLKLPGEEQCEAVSAPVEYDKKDKANLTLFALLAFALLAMIAGLLFIFWPQLERWFPKPPQIDTRVASFAEVSGVPEGAFSYTAERDGTWSYLLQGKPADDQRLVDLLTEPRARVEMRFVPVISPKIDTESEAVRLVQLIRTDFAITSLTEDLSDDLESKPIAIDGLVVYVAFSKKPRNLPNALGGKISLENLQKLYTGKVRNWKELGGPDLPVRLFAPTEPEAVRMFERLVLGNDPQRVATFRSLATVLPTKETQRLVLPEFDNNRSGIIAFSTLVKAFDQCSGYPLALDQGKGEIQPLVQTDPRFDGQPIHPNVNLCAKAFRLDAGAFTQRRYPLGFPLAVVYPRDNSRPTSGLKFAELLTTRQGQQYLEKLGVVPLPLSNK